MIWGLRYFWFYYCLVLFEAFDFVCSNLHSVCWLSHCDSGYLLFMFFFLVLFFFWSSGFRKFVDIITLKFWVMIVILCFSFIYSIGLKGSILMILNLEVFHKLLELLVLVLFLCWVFWFLV